MKKNNTSFYRLRQTRQRFLDLIEGLEQEQLEMIPQGFSNNILWNFGHVIATQQLLCYGRSNVAMPIAQEFIDLYRKGTAPNGNLNASELEEMKALAMSSVDQMEKDYEAGIFQTYSEYQTSYGILLKDLEEAIDFVCVHEALHLGYAMAQRKCI